VKSNKNLVRTRCLLLRSKSPKFIKAVKRVLQRVITRVTRHSCELLTVNGVGAKKHPPHGDQLTYSEISARSQRQHKPGCAKSPHSAQQMRANTALIAFSAAAIASQAYRLHFSSKLASLVSWPFLPVADERPTPSFLWFAAMQSIECQKHLADLTPKRRLISTEAVQGVVGHVGDTQKAAREIWGRMDGSSEGFPPELLTGFRCFGGLVRCRIPVEAD
jgi:hypothetical protein